MLAPVKHTMPAISMEYQRALMETHRHNRQHQDNSIQAGLQQFYVCDNPQMKLHSSRLSPFPHDVSIERVEDTLVSQLERLVQDLHVFAALRFSCVPTVLS